MSSPADAFQPLRSALEHAGVRYAIGGSWASTAFGEPRFTNDVDIVAELSEHSVRGFVHNLPRTFYVDEDEAASAVRNGRPFNVIHMPTALKFDLFPASAFPLGEQELDRAIVLGDTGLSREPAPYVTAEDILLAKLYWYRLGHEVSEVQWRDIEGVTRTSASILDRGYLERGAAVLGVVDLLEKALKTA